MKKSKPKTKEPDRELLRISQELGLPPEKITRYGEGEMKAKSNEICVYRQKLGLFICYKK